MNIDEAAADRADIPASLVHVWAIDGRPYQTWAEVEAHVSAFVAAEGRRWDGLVVWSCYGVRVGNRLVPLAQSGTVPFAVAEWPGGEVKWTLAPPGAGQPVFATGRLVGWAMVNE